MDVEYKIAKDKNNSVIAAHIKERELIQGQLVIYLGSNVEKQELSFSQYKKHLYNKRLRSFPSYSQHLEDDAEILLIHEFIHLLLWKITNNLYTVCGFDDVDRCDEISGYGFL